MIFNASTARQALLLGCLAVVAFLLGILVGHYSVPNGDDVPVDVVPLAMDEGTSSDFKKDDTLSIITSRYENYGEDKWIKEKDLIETIINRIDAKKIKENHRYLTEEPHVAASERDNELANHIRNQFEQNGFDVAQLVPYNLLLTKPNTTTPNLVTLHDGSNEFFRSSFKEEPIHPDDDSPDFIHAFNAFTPAVTVKTARGSGVVYVNYGRIEDFTQLQQLGVNISGHIAIARYGKIYRGNKIRNAERSGALGIILFSDPKDVAIEGTEPADVYDKTWWLPGTGMQRGSTYLGDGDPLTPGWPSTEHAYRISIDEADLHKIPSQPIGYNDARVILELLDGQNAPLDWQGGLKNHTYKLGPMFNLRNANVTLQLSTHNIMEVMKSYNVLGMIKGSVEPDRYVMIGNHRDAWGYGASDPSSGTAQMLETARVFGTLLKEGWRPRRTLVFNSWGAEEFGLIGSTEWVEEKINKLQQRTVAYVNTDTCASGPILHAGGSPLMWDVVINMTKLIPGVVDASKTLYDEWRDYHVKLNKDNPDKPMVGILGSGSDHASFAFYGGIPAVDFWFRRDQTKHNITIYPAYHTGFDTFYMVSTFIDPEYRIMQGCGRLASLTLKYLADSTIIPFSISKLPQEMMKALVGSKHRETFRTIYDKYDELENSVKRFQMATDNFMQNMTARNIEPMRQRAINDQLMKLEQSFIIPEGLPGRPTTRHAVFAPSKYDNYASNGFPGLTDYVFDYHKLEASDKSQRDKDIRKHISDLTILTDRATSLLEESHVL